MPEGRTVMPGTVMPSARAIAANQSTEELAAQYTELHTELTALQERIDRIGPQHAVLRNELVHRAYEVPCPKHRCRADAGYYCVNLNAGGNKKWPHRERIAAYFAAVGTDEPAGLTW